MIYDNYGEALMDAELLSDFNDVGFKVLDLQEVLEEENAKRKT